MKSNFVFLFLVLMVYSSTIIADTPLIRTTVSDSSRVSFIAQTPLSWESTEYDSLDFIRFSTSVPS